MNKIRQGMPIVIWTCLGCFDRIPPFSPSLKNKFSKYLKKNLYIYLESSIFEKAYTGTGCPLPKLNNY